MDAYQQAVEYLTENPDELIPAWENPRVKPGGCLFLFVESASNLPGKCGCLTMIRCAGYGYVASTPDLTIAIRSDERIPDSRDGITVDHLPIFAGWQRRIDRELGRTPPALDPRLPMPKGDIEFAENDLREASPSASTGK